MADNYTTDPGAGGNQYASDDVGGVHYPRVKIALGAPDAYDTDLDSGSQTSANSVPVVLASDHADVSIDDGGNSITVDAADLTTIAGAVAAEGAALGSGVLMQGDDGTDRTNVLVDTDGHLQVDVVTAPSTAVTNAGTFAVQEDGAALTALQLIDDVVATDDTSTHATGSTKGAVVMAAATPTDSAVQANDLGALAMSLDRRLHVDADITAQSAGDITIADGGNAITVDWNGTAPPIGAGVEATALRVTVATDSTGVLSVDDNGGNLSVDLAGTAPTLNSGTVDAGTQRVVLATDVALPAGTNAIGKLAANSGVDIGDVDILSVTPGTAAGNLGKAEDAVHTTGDVGVQMLAVRKDTATALAGTDGDYAPLEVDASGRLHSIVTNAGTFSVQLSGNGLTALQLIDDIVQTDDTSTHSSGTTRGALIMAAATPTDTSVNANDLGAVAMSTDRRLHVDSQIVGQDADVTIADGGNSITVDASELTTIAAAVAAEGAALGSGVLMQGDDGTDRTNVLVDTDGHLQVDILSGGGGGTQYTEDDAAAANPVGTQVVLVRQDTPATLVSADGDVVAQRSTNYGAAFVQVVDSSGNFIDTFGGSGGTSHADDAAFTIGSASSITPTGYLADETTPDSVDEGDVGVPRMTLNRKPYAVISDPTSENSAGVDGSGHLQVDIAADSVGIGGGTQYSVDAALGATPTGTLALAKRDDALSALTPVEGDAVDLRVDANGALWVQHSGDVTIADGGNVISTDWNGTAPPIGAGVEATALRVTVATDSTGVLSVDDGAGSLTIDNADITTIAGAVAAEGAALGSGVLMQGDDGTDRTNVLVDTDGHLQVDVLSAPSTAVTNAGVFAVQEDGAALTALQLIDDIVATDDTSTHATGTTKGAVIMAAATPTDGSVGVNDLGAVAMSLDRRLHVDSQIVGQDADLTIADGGNAITVDWNGTAPPIGAGVEATALRVTVATDSTGVLSVDDNGGNLSIDLAGTAPTLNSGTVDGGTQRVVLATDVALPAGTNAIGKLAANSGVDIGDVDVLSIAAGSNLVGDVGLSGARTSGGTTMFKDIDVDETSAGSQVKGSAGQVYWIHAMNLGSSTRFLKFYDNASVTVGTTTPDLTFALPTQGDSNGAGFTLSIPNGIAFANAIKIAATTGVADNDTGAPGANEVIVNIGYA